MTTRLRLGLVDDHPAILMGVIAGLRADLPELGQTASARNVGPIVAGAAMLDLVLLDVQLDDGSDPADNVARLVAARLPVLLYTQDARPALLARCFLAGAHGIVNKSEPFETLVEAIRTVARGEHYLNAQWASALEDAADWPVPDLAPREAEAMRLYATGLPMKSVARRMGVTEPTAKEYLDRAREKYAAAGRRAATKVDLYVRAVEDGYLPQPGLSSLA